MKNRLARKSLGLSAVALVGLVAILGAIPVRAAEPTVTVPVTVGKLNGISFKAASFPDLSIEDCIQTNGTLIFLSTGIGTWEASTSSTRGFVQHWESSFDVQATGHAFTLPPSPPLFDSPPVKYPPTSKARTIIPFSFNANYFDSITKVTQTYNCIK